MSFSREGNFGVITDQDVDSEFYNVDLNDYTDEALPRTPSMESADFNGARKPRPVRSTSISLSSEPTQSGLSFVLGLEEEEQTLEHSYSLHEDIEKLFDKTPQITLTDLISSGTESLPSGRGIEIEPEIPIAAGDRVLEEYEVTSHRRSSFPHIHVPLKSLHNHSVKNFATMMDDISPEKKKRRKRKGSKKSHHKKQKSTIFPSKSALLSPAIPEVEKEEYSSQDESSSAEGEEEEGDADNVSETRIEIEDIGSHQYEDMADDQDDLGDSTCSETTRLLIDLEESDGEHREKRKPPVELIITEPIDTYNAAEENKHLTVPWLNGGVTDKAGSDSSFKPGLFYIGSDLHTRLAVTTSGGSETPSPAISTVASAVPLYEGLSDSAPVVVVLESDDHRPLVSTSIKQATIHTAVHVLDTSPKTSVSEDYDKVKFLLGEAEDAEDGYHRRDSTSSSSDSDSDSDDDENDESSDEEKENKADSTHEQHEGQNHKEHKVHHEPLWQLQDEMKIPAAKPRKRHKSRHKRENYKMEDLERRRLRGSEVHIPDALKRVPTETEEAVTLHSADLDTMASHRMDDLKGFHKHKIGRKKHKTDKSRSGKPDKSRRKYFKPEAKKYDHTPHEVFVELDELYVNEEHHEVEWREKARWIKFEEDVEEGAERWGKPHVASLSFHSLLELRKGLEQGSLLLDLEATDLITICHRVVENMVIHDQIPSEVKGQVMRSLLTRHKFVSAETVKSLIQRSISNIDLTNLDQRHQRELASLMKTFSQASFTHGASSTNLANLAPNQNHNHETNNGHLDNHTSTNNFENQTLLTVPQTLLTVPGDVRRVSISLPEENNHRSSKKDKSKKKTSEGDAGRLELVKVDVANKTDLEDGIHIGLVPKEVDKEEQPRSDQNVTLLKRISRDAEACTVLIGQVNYLDKPAIAFVRLAEKQVLDNLTEVPLPVRFLFILLGPPKNAMDYHEVGRSIATLMANQHFHEIAYRAESRSEILHAINEFLNESIVLPPGDWDQKTLLPVMDMARKRAHIRRKKQKKKEELEALLQREILHKIPMDPLKRTGRPFGGLINDIRRRFPHYASDFTDALNLQCVMALIFIFFACLCPCIAFGGLYGEKTNGKIGVVETILATSLTNIVFGFLSGQPLIVYGATGPVLVFEKQLYSFCKNSDIDFLTWRVWISLWVFVITLVVLALEGSFIVRYITRFTEEVFAILIALIFINEVLQKLIAIYKEHPLREKQFYCDTSNNKLIDEAIIDLNSTTILPLLESVANATARLTTSTPSTYSTLTGNYSLMKNQTDIHTHEKSKYVKITNEPNTALLSTILIFGTFLIAYFLRIFRNSKFLGRSARRALGDFGIFTAIVVMVLFDYICADTFTQKLHLPETFSHSDSTISQWFVNPLGAKKPLQTWLMFIAVIPGFLFFLLLFLETQLTQMLLHKNEFKLKKGSGFHLDQFILGIITLLCGLFGLPWMCPATVRSVVHVSSLAVMSKTHAPGEKPKLLEVKDQRVTNLMMNLIIGSCIIWGELLRSVPMAVLFGVFLYLGTAAISGVQLYKRFKLLFIPVKHHPGKSYVRRVRTIKMHAFTIIQVVLVALLWIVKSTVVAIAFPLFVFLMVPLRLKILPKFFTHDELEMLDKEEEDSEDEEDLDPDFYQLAHMPI